MADAFVAHSMPWLFPGCFPPVVRQNRVLLLNHGDEPVSVWAVGVQYCPDAAPPEASGCSGYRILSFSPRSPLGEFGSPSTACCFETETFPSSACCYRQTFLGDIETVLVPVEACMDCQPHLKRTNKSYRVDETYIKVKGQDKYLYRAVDSTGQTIDFLLTAKRDTAAAKRFFEKVFSSSSNPIPRVINVDKNPAYPAAVEALKAEGTLPRRVRLRQCKYLNNVIEQDHRTVKKRTWLAKGCGSFQSAWRTLEGIETVNMIRKGRVRRVTKGNVVAEAKFILGLFAITA